MSFQKIYFDKKLNPVKVEVMNDEEDVLIRMTFKDVNLDKKFDKDYFTLDANMKVSKDDSIIKPVSKIEDEIYPMYIPVNTRLSSKETINLDKGQRVIMTFEGENPFMVAYQTASVSEDGTIVSVDGEPYQTATSVAAISDNMISWVSSGIEYYVVGEKLSEEDLVSVANSMAVIPTSK